ncbi:MAG TPA: hypothetical protein VFU46_01115 [Gemmatimonadales bacterium]|nr:hypothetical protein [Gemmatimonadales bacterium]
MTAGPDQGEPLRERERVAGPEAQRRIGAHHPFAVGLVQPDRNPAQRAAPLDHGRVVVRVGDGDRPGPTGRLHGGDRGIVHQRDAVPENGKPGIAHEQRALPDREWGLDHHPDQVGTLRENDDGVTGVKLSQRRPPLPLEADELPLVLADAAALGRQRRLGVLGTAGRADEVGHSDE